MINSTEMCFKFPSSGWRSHLIAKEFIQISQLFPVGNLTIQRRVGLHHPCGPADSNGGISLDPLSVLVCPMVGV